jgi:hypothetical protein
MAVSTKHLRFAVKNIARYGDTDIFPHPLENYIFFDRDVEVVAILEELDQKFDDSLQRYPPIFVKSLSVVGYHGFRSATQIDPLWNAYLLALVISIGEEIEKARSPIEKEIVFSYRFKPDMESASIFDPQIGWRAYQEASIRRARQQTFVLSCDIADFYPRVYHHRLENALKRASANTESIRRIMRLLSILAGGVSYGLPIGGPAARLLSELVLNRVDRLLGAEKIEFCRFVDDFHIFTTSREAAYANLVSLSQILLENEGLALNRAKTRIMTADEFLSSSAFAEENEPKSEHERESRRFIQLRLRYDPYSPTADEDYQALQDELEKFDVVGMLAREIAKARIDESVTRQLLRAIKYLDDRVKDDAILSLIDNLTTLYPVFPTVMTVVRSTLADVSERTKQAVFERLRNLISQNSYITQVPANLAFALRVLAYDASDETDGVLTDLYKKPLDMMIKRDIILIMTRRNADYWISNCRRQYAVLTPWERRALGVASYILEDEGVHWRDDIKKEASPLDRVAMAWAAEKKNSGAWDLPL